MNDISTHLFLSALYIFTILIFFQVKDQTTLLEELVCHEKQGEWHREEEKCLYDLKGAE